MPELTVVARARAKPGREADLERELRAIIGPSQKEAGCLGYVLHRSLQDPACFMTIETWASKEDVDKHMGMPYIQALFAKAAELVSGIPDINVYEPLT
jgi:quinol monooxygenase YgiN